MASLGCAPTGFEARLSSLEEEEAERRQRLDELEHQITRAELKVDHAKARVAYHDCKAARATIDAKTVLYEAQCFQDISAHAQCVAENERDTATGAALGCLLGVGAAVVTGGAAAPAALVGCGGGAVLGYATREKCGDIPRCASQVNEMESLVLAEYGLTRAPTCTAPPELVLPERPEPPKPSAAEPEPRSRPVARRTVCTDQRVEWIEFSAPPRKANGQAWDARGGAPDLTYLFRVEGGGRYESKRHEGLTWRHEPDRDIRVASQQRVTIQLFDADLQSAENIGVFRSLVAIDTREPASLEDGEATARIKFQCVEE